MASTAMHASPKTLDYRPYEYIFDCFAEDQKQRVPQLLSIPSNPEWKDITDRFLSADPELQPSTDTKFGETLGALALLEITGTKNAFGMLSSTDLEESQKIIREAIAKLRQQYFGENSSSVSSSTYRRALTSIEGSQFLAGASLMSGFLLSYSRTSSIGIGHSDSIGKIDFDPDNLNELIKTIPLDAVHSDHDYHVDRALKDQGIRSKSTLEWHIGGSSYRLIKLTPEFRSQNNERYLFSEDGKPTELNPALVEHLYNHLLSRVQKRNEAMDLKIHREFSHDLTTALDQLFEVLVSDKSEKLIEPNLESAGIFIGKGAVQIGEFVFKVHKSNETGSFSLSVNSRRVATDDLAAEAWEKEFSISLPQYYINSPQEKYLLINDRIQAIGAAVYAINESRSEIAKDKTRISPLEKTILSELEQSNADEWPVHEGFLFFRYEKGNPVFGSTLRVILPSGTLIIDRTTELSPFDRPLPIMITAHTSAEWSGERGEDVVSMTFTPKGSNIATLVSQAGAAKLYELFERRAEAESPDSSFNCVLESELRRRNPIASGIRRAFGRPYYPSNPSIR